MASPKSIASALAVPPQGRAVGDGAMSPLVAGYNQWVAGRQMGPALPRPIIDFLSGSFGPQSPLLPMPIDVPDSESGRPEPRRWQYPVGWNLPVGQPGTEGYKLASFPTLRKLADVYSVVRAMLNIRINELAAFNWDVGPTANAMAVTKGDKGAVKEQRERADLIVNWFKRIDSNYHGFQSWLSAVLEDQLVIDAVSLHYNPTRVAGKGLFGSNLAELELINGETIRPLMNIRGAIPRPPEPAFQQYLWGVPRSDMISVMAGRDLDAMADDMQAAGVEMGDPDREYAADQLLYLPRIQRSWTPYGFSAIEQALLPITIGINRQGFLLDYFTEGTIPGVYVIAGDQYVTPAQQRQLQDTLNALAGDMAWKHRVIVLPPGSKTDPQKDMSWVAQVDQSIAEQVGMILHIQPHEVGMVPGGRTSGLGGKGAMEGAQASAAETRTIPDRKWLKETLFDWVIQKEFGQHDLEWKWLDDEEDQQEIAARSAAEQADVSVGKRSIDEIRVENGLDPWNLPLTKSPIFTLGPIQSLDPDVEPPAPAAPKAPVGPDGEPIAPAAGAPGAEKPPAEDTPEKATATTSNDEVDSLLDENTVDDALGDAEGAVPPKSGSRKVEGIEESELDKGQQPAFIFGRPNPAYSRSAKPEDIANELHGIRERGRHNGFKGNEAAVLDTFKRNLERKVRAGIVSRAVKATGKVPTKAAVDATMKRWSERWMDHLMAHAKDVLQHEVKSGRNNTRTSRTLDGHRVGKPGHGFRNSGTRFSGHWQWGQASPKNMAKAMGEDGVEDEDDEWQPLTVADLVKGKVRYKGDVTNIVHDYLLRSYPPDVIEWVDDGDWEFEPHVNLSDINMARRPGGRDPAKVGFISQSLSVGASMDPVVLVKRDPENGYKYDIADGWHRTLGAEKAGVDDIPAFVGSGFDDKAGWGLEMQSQSASRKKAAIAELGVLRRFLRKGSKVENFRTSVIDPDIMRTLSDDIEKGVVLEDALAAARDRVESVEWYVDKFNDNHDDHGRFASSDGGGAKDDDAQWLANGGQFDGKPTPAGYNMRGHRISAAYTPGVGAGRLQCAQHPGASVVLAADHYIRCTGDPAYRTDATKSDKRIEPQDCHYGDHPATKSLLWAEHMAYVPVCDEHEASGRSAIEEHDEVEDVVAIKTFSLDSPLSTGFVPYDLAGSRTTCAVCGTPLIGPRERRNGVCSPHEAAFNKYSDSEPRDAHGQWTHDGGAGWTADPAAAGVSPNGFSIHPYRGTSPRTGYQVAMTGHTTKLPASIMDDHEALAKALVEHRDQNADVYKAGGHVYLGGWVQDGQLWLEPSERVTSRADAVRLGQERDQISVWDNANQQEIATGGSGDVGKAAQGSGDASVPGELGQPDRRAEAGGYPGDGDGNPEAGADQADPLTKYSDAQPREPAGSPEGGRWTSGGGDGAAGDAQTSAGATRVADELAQGKQPTVDPKDVGRVLDACLGRKDNPDLTELKVKGTLKFGGDGLGIARADMPQIPGELRDQFRADLKTAGIKVTDEDVKPQDLKPIQKEISATSVAGMLQTMRDEKSVGDVRILTTEDGYVIDGHHHWGAATAYSFEQPNVTMPVSVIHADHQKVLDFALKWGEDHGIAHRAMGKTAKPAQKVVSAPLDLLAAIDAELARRGIDI